MIGQSLNRPTGLTPNSETNKCTTPSYMSSCTWLLWLQPCTSCGRFLPLLSGLTFLKHGSASKQNNLSHCTSLQHVNTEIVVFYWNILLTYRVSSSNTSMPVISHEISVPLPTFVAFHSLEYLKYYFYKTILYLPNLDFTFSYTLFIIWYVHTNYLSGGT